MAWLAVGGSVAPITSNGWDFAPLVGTLAALAALVLGLRLPASWQVLVFAFALGVLWAVLVGAWGVAAPTGVAFLALSAARSVRRRTQDR
jgi:hypothetical protein